MAQTEEEVKFISIPEAIEIAARKYGIYITTPTVISWVSENRLGHQPGGTRFSPRGKKGSHWLVDKRRWEDFLEGTVLG